MGRSLALLSGMLLMMGPARPAHVAGPTASRPDREPDSGRSPGVRAPAAGPASRPDAASAMKRHIDALIADLGSARYDVREQAADRLRRIGRRALAALTRAAASDDPEVRVRAREVLTDVRLGVQPDWPAEIVLLVRHYGCLEPSERIRAIARVSNALQARAAPFLVSRLAGGTEQEASAALDRLKRFNDEATYRQVIEGIRQPATAHQARALGWALTRSGRPTEALAVYSRAGVDNGDRGELIAAGVKRIEADLAGRQFEEAARAAAAFSKAAPEDARFPYLGAEAMIALGRDDEAQELRARADGLNPADESTHFSAGELLMKLGRRRLAVREWEAILRIPPDDGVYDVNAHLRLGAIYESCRLYARAADCFSRAVERMDRLRRDHGAVGLIGGTEAELRRHAAELRTRAEKSPAPPDAKVEDRLGDDDIAVAVDIRVKDGKSRQLRRALGQVQATVTVRVQPVGLRIFDVAPAGFQYDPEKKQLWVTLHGSRCGEPVDARLDGRHVRLAVRHLDCCYIYEVDPTTGRAKKLARFEKDYQIRLVPGRRVAGYADVKVKINDKTHNWQELLEGAKFDFLPATLNIVLEATAPSGDSVTRKFSVACREPAVRPMPEDSRAGRRPATRPGHD